MKKILSLLLLIIGISAFSQAIPDKISAKNIVCNNIKSATGNGISVVNPITFLGTATYSTSPTLNTEGLVWQRMYIPFESMRKYKGTIPALKPFYDSVNVHYLFPKNDTTANFNVNVVLPTDRYVAGTSIVVALAWQQDSVRLPTWACVYKKAGLGVAWSAWTKISGSAVSMTYSSGSVSQLTVLGYIDMSAITIEPTIKFRIYRSDNLLSVDAKANGLVIFYQVDGLGSSTYLSK